MDARYRLAIAFAAGSAVLAACGTTVPMSSQSAAADDAGTGGPGQSVSGSGTGGTTGSTSGSTTGSAPESGTGQGGAGGGGQGMTGGATTGSVGGGGAGSSSTGSATTGSRAVNVPGVTATTINVGVYTAAGYSNAAKAAGFNVALGDMAAEAREVMDYINAHGGVLGRKLVAVVHDANVALAAQNPSAEYQAACADWTQDHHVYAVVSPIGASSNTLYDCLSKANVPTINSGESTDASFFQRYPNYFYEPTDLNLRRVFSNQVDALKGAGFFGKAPKIGVLIADNPYEHAAVDNGLKPALARNGLTLADTFAVSNANNASEYSSAVLKFRTEGITHVLFAFQGSPLQFMIAADNQGYYPRYGLHSRTSPAPVLQADASARQQHGAMGIGWQPMNDVDGAHDPGILNARQKLCLDLVKKSGQDPSVRATALIGLWLCDDIFFLHDALTRAGSFGIPAFRAGAESLTSYEAASTFRSGFAPGQLHDGAKQYRIFAYKDDCKCYEYVSPLRNAS